MGRGQNEAINKYTQEFPLLFCTNPSAGLSPKSNINLIPRTPPTPKMFENTFLDQVL